uniref:ENTH domain-containing protein n=1 Tax=Physcomitrium patens TaxID=3218 RepID=A0A2K1KGI5_PHYPA|nr:hypothetical protein PHYPA_009266 [Physcomitrium patens]
MNQATLVKNLVDARETLCKIDRVRHGGFDLSAMDLKKVLDQTVREFKREVNKKVLKVPEIELKVCEATSNEPWGPHGAIMGDIAQATRNFQDYHMIMGVLWKRLHDSGKNWRHVYKSLAVMEYLIANGAERVIDELREQAYQIQVLLDFQHIEPNGKDQGINVRKKAESLLALINDPGKIRELQQKAAANRDKYRGLSNTGMSFKPSSYLSTSGSYSDKENERYGGGSSVNAQKDDEVHKEDQRESNRDEMNDGREHHEGYVSSKVGDRKSDKSSAEGDMNLDLDDCRSYSRCSASKGVVSAVMRAHTNLLQASTGPTPEVPPSTSSRGLFFTIKSTVDDSNDFDPRGTSRPSDFSTGWGWIQLKVPVAKHEMFTQHSRNAALEDLFTDVEFQASFPPIAAPLSENGSEHGYPSRPHAHCQASTPSPLQPPPSEKIITNNEFQPFAPVFPESSADSIIGGKSFEHFNPPFASLESQKPHTRESVNEGFYPLSDHPNKFNSRLACQLEQTASGSSTKTMTDDMDLFGSFNPFCTKPHVLAGNEEALQLQPQTNPFLSTTSSSAFWNDPLITSLVDFSIAPGQKKDQNPPLSMNEIGFNMAASGSSAPRPSSLLLSATTLTQGRAHVSNIMGPGIQR